MHGSKENVHQDVIRIIASSDNSFDDAVKQGIKELKKGKFHQDLKFVSYEVVQLQGTIKDTEKSCEAEFYQVVLDVAGVHKH
ncbi:dodecin domain-containing protein [Mastigocoleus sp. MO_188.B34]|uniref:dodecin domain-containing protein n=1 Tax=Mastigocoleus sp. MO_188.B34 TaxID=3036635 RepID=UPI00263A151D|nr:dodecin domain-containing protein [Mastigocoleus sp. MO_188.B34]MDJ0695977.1 dodecin domain-containing protein [Mastigocoleus sp. MO_188.B34]